MVQWQITLLVMLCHRFKSCWFFWDAPAQVECCDAGSNPTREDARGVPRYTDILLPCALRLRKKNSEACQKKPRGYLDSIDRKKLNDTVRTSAFARCHYMPKCEHHMIQLQVVIKFLLLMYFLHDLCLASTNRTRDL
jgi:hypothetical protein